MDKQINDLRVKYNVQYFELVEQIKLKDLAELQEIGKGTAGTVYKAFWKNSIEVAVKFVSYDKFFIQEFCTLSTLRHNNIVSLYGYGFDEKWFYVMEWASNGTLNSLIKNSKDMSVDQAVEFITQIARAVDYIHSKGWVYQDLKPDNILLFDGNILKLADFGLARRSDSDEEPMGTPEYMAPESQWAKISPNQDVYAFGCVLKRLTAKISDCPEWIGEVALECLKEAPTLRPTMAEVLDRIAESQTT